MVAIGTDDKKKLYILLALAGVLGVVMLVVFNPFGGRKTASRITTTPVGGPGSPDDPAGLRPGGPRPGGAPGGSADPDTPGAGAGTTPAGTGATGQPIQLIKATSRPDPFKPFYSPTLPPRAPIPGPLDIPSPTAEASMPLNLPTEFGEELGESGALKQLPPVRVPSAQGKSGPSVLPPTEIQSGSQPQRSPNKRLSGVILGDSIYALLEISTADQTISRVVQPGDEVEGIKILRIERINDNGVQRTRMTVLEGGQERFFDLQAAPQQAAGGAGLGGPGGAAGLGGLPGGLPGRPGGRPGAAIRPGGGPPLP